MSTDLPLLQLLREHAHADVGGLPFGVVVRVALATRAPLVPATLRISEHGEITVEQAPRADDSSVGRPHLGYVAPEHIREHTVDERSDVFVLGTLLWEMFVGRRLFKRDTDMQMLYAILEEDTPPPSSRDPRIPTDVDRVVLRALARDPAARYPNLAALADDLRALAAQHGWDTSAAPLAALVRDQLPAPAPAADPAPVQRGFALVFVVVVGVFIASVVFWLAIAPRL